MNCSRADTGAAIREHLNYWGEYLNGAKAGAALLAVLDRMDAEINARFSPENVGKPPVPADMLRVYIHQDIARILGVPDA